MAHVRSGQVQLVRGRREPRRLRTVAVVGVLVLASVLAGCSSDDDPAATPSTPVAPAGSPDAGSAAGTTPAPLLTLTSPAFEDGGPIPVRHACVNQGGENSSPPLAWTGVPDDTETLVLVVNDPDAAMPGGFTHLVTTIPTDVTSLDDGASLTGAGPMMRWIGPCPPSGEHHYVFTLYAFGPDVTVPADADKTAIEDIADQALAVATLTGLFASQG